MRRALAFLVLAALATAFAGCGGRFPLPMQVNQPIPTDKSYQLMATWSGMTGIRDILLTQGTGTQLFLLFNYGGTGTGTRGRIVSLARLQPDGFPRTDPSIVFNGLFNPIALCVGGDGKGSAANRIFVLDQGDTIIARANPITGIYGDTTGLSTTLAGKWMLDRVSHLEYYWRVRETGLLGRDPSTGLDTCSTFTDTSLAYVDGIAADAEGRVYVSGVFPYRNAKRDTIEFRARIRRYARGPLPTVPPTADYRMPGCNWHIDGDWEILNGTGSGYVLDPRGLSWGQGTNALYVAEAELGRGRVQKLGSSIVAITGTDDALFSSPLDVVADQVGYIYVADTGNRRVLRFDDLGVYVQIVNVAGQGPDLLNPVTVAADDSLVFVGDPLLAQVFRYKRRS